MISAFTNIFKIPELRQRVLEGRHAQRLADHQRLELNAARGMSPDQMRAAQAALAQQTEARVISIVGPGAVRKGNYDARPYQSTHNTGGTIMGADPATSVVSPRLQHWDADNLFVVGASLYTHNSGFNPTGPLGALSLRLSEDLLSYVKHPTHLA